MWWRRISQVSGDADKEYTAFLKDAVSLPAGKFFRHNQAGDLIPESGYRDRISLTHCIQLMNATNRKKAFTFTHYPVLRVKGISQETIDINRSIIEQMNSNGFSVSVSCNSVMHADQVIDSGIKAPVTTILPRRFKSEKISISKSPGGRTVITCPASINDKMTCVKCKSCMNPQRKVIIGFPAHGSGFRHCERIMSEWGKGVPVS